jgi:adenosylmethionine-8-amino-7-oxononanoate aminotransferase
MTHTPDELRDWDRRHLWHAFTQMAEYEPLIIERAEGCWLVDIDGRRYLDGVSSLWCNLHGHRHPRIEAAITEQLGKLAHATTLGMSNPPAIELARRLTDLAPAGLNHVFYSSDGACAVEAALKTAFQYWRQRTSPRPHKQTYLAFDSAYHGDTIGSTSLGGIDRFHTIFEPLLFDVLRLPTPDRRHGDAATHLARLEEALARDHERLAAVVLEPLVQGAAGMIMQPPGYLRGVRELTQKYDVLLIADEIVTGFGRTGRMFACEHAGIAPDLLCLSKGLTGGYLPLAATLASEEIYAAFLSEERGRAFFHGHSYTANALACAVARASLALFAETNCLGRIAELQRLFARRLAVISALPGVARVRGIGALAVVELEAPAGDRDSGYLDARGPRLAQEFLDRGVLLRPLGNIVYFLPPCAITDEECHRVFDVIEETLLGSRRMGAR